MKNSKLRILIECALMIALATVLSLIKIYEAPYGGSVTLCSMVPLFLVAYRHGVKWGFGTCFVYSVINLLLGIKDLAYIPTPAGILACIFLDYILAFTILGIAGAFRGMKLVKSETLNVVLTTTIVVALALVLRFACHVVSGAVIWYDLTKLWYADDPTHIVNQYGAWLYSTVYNATFMLPEFVLTLLATPLLRRLLEIADRHTRTA